ncbi:signal protein [Streptomyces sp. Y1]|uniref:Signal protein n=1 Tax=Streptomyces sp. Y1 TaxID=3238634 RepID=A0AB39TQG2_9ACTN
MHIRRSIALLVGATALVGACSSAPAAPHPDASTPAPAASAGAGASSASGTSSASAASPGASAAGSGGAPTKLSAAEVQGRWWTWAASSASDVNPVSDRDGHLCAQGQKGGIWFLAGSFGETVTRSCTVPAGVPVAFPLVNLVGEAADCEAFMATAKGSATLDGKALEPDRYEGTTVAISGVEGNPLTQRGGRFSTRACGLWVQAEPLAPGSHTLSIRGSSGSFAVSVDYALQVSAG